MKLIESEKFRKHGQELDKVLRQNPELDHETREALEVQKADRGAPQH